MNKKSNFTRTVLLSALLCGIAGPSFVGCKDYDDDIEGPSFVGCKDYDDDIDALQAQIDENKDAIAALEQQISGGAIVTKVESDGNGGVVITLSDGTTHTITKGDKGDDGTSAPTPIFQISNGILQVRYSTEEAWQDLGKVTPDAEALEFTIDEATGELMLNGESLGKVVGEAGKPLAVDFRISDTGMLEYLNQEGKWVEIGQVTGANGATPKLQFKLENGQLMYQDANAIEPEWVAVDGFNMNDILTNYMTLSVDENGMLCVGGEPTDVQVNYEIYLVEKDGAMMLHLPYKNTEGVWVYRDITLPTTDIFGKIVTSVNFVPMFADKGDLSMYKLTAQVGTPAKEYLASSSVLRFRVSPNTAVYGTDYTIAESMDYFLTRAAQETPLFSVAYNEEMTKENNDGLVYVKFDFDESEIDMDKKYTLALGLNDLHNEGRMVYSNYINFSPVATPLNSAWKLVKEDAFVDGTDVKIVHEANSTVDMAKEVAFAGSEDNTKWAKLDAFGFENLTYTVEFATTASAEDKQYFKIEGTVVTLLDGTFQTKTESVPVKVSALLNGEVIAEEVFNVNVGEADPSIDEDALNIIHNVTVSDFVGNDLKKEITLVEGGLNLLNTFFDAQMSGVSPAFEITDVEGNDASDMFTMFTNLSSDPIEFTVKANAKVGTYKVVATYTQGTKVATVTFTITITEVMLEKNPEYWDNENLVVRATNTGVLKADLTQVFKPITGTALTFDVSTASSEDVEIAADGKTLQLTATGAKKLAINSYYDVVITYELKNSSTSEVLVEEAECNVRFYNPILTLTTKVEQLTMADGTDNKLNLLDAKNGYLVGLTVDDRSGSAKEIISNSLVVTKPVNGQALASTYGVAKIDFVEVEDDSRVEIVDGVLTWKNTGSALASPFTIRLKLQIENNWKTIEKEVTVVVSPKFVQGGEEE